MSRNRRRREPIEVAIDNLSHEGRGVGRVNGKTVFVAGALPGEQVVARKVRGRKSFDEALALEIENPNPQRVNPRCAHYAICGGCSLQHLGSEQQIQHKQSVLLELFEHHAEIAPEEILAPIAATPWGYRRRARLGVKFVEKKGGVLVGFREKASPYIADIERCEVLDPRVGEQLMTLRALIARLSINTKIPQLEVAIGDDTTAIIVRHLQPFTDQDLEILTEFQNQSQISLYLQPEGEASVHPLNSQTRTLSYHVGELEFKFSPSNFVQVNHAINCQMIDTVIDHLQLQVNDTVLDLFCGLGNFTLPISKSVKHVHGIEGDEALVQLAGDNARHNAVGNATFEKMDLSDEDLLNNIELTNYNKLLLDPPRSGAEQLLLSGNLDTVDLLAYVSCNPVTLARDAKHLLKKHQFKLTKLGVMDMFPHTAHVESLAIFAR